MRPADMSGVHVEHSGTHNLTESGQPSKENNQQQSRHEQARAEIQQLVAQFNSQKPVREAILASNDAFDEKQQTTVDVLTYLAEARERNNQHNLDTSR